MTQLASGSGRIAIEPLKRRETTPGIEKSAELDMARSLFEVLRPLQAALRRSSLPVRLLDQNVGAVLSQLTTTLAQKNLLAWSGKLDSQWLKVVLTLEHDFLRYQAARTEEQRLSDLKGLNWLTPVDNSFVTYAEKQALAAHERVVGALRAFSTLVCSVYSAKLEPKPVHNVTSAPSTETLEGLIQFKKSIDNNVRLPPHDLVTEMQKLLPEVVMKLGIFQNPALSGIAEAIQSFGECLRQLEITKAATSGIADDKNNPNSYRYVLRKKSYEMPWEIRRKLVEFLANQTASAA